MLPNSREHPHVVSDTSPTPSPLASYKTQLANIQKQGYDLKHRIEQIKLESSYKKAEGSIDDMTKWKSTFRQEMTTRKTKVEEAKKELGSLILERGGVLETGGAKKKSELSESKTLDKEEIVEVKESKKKSDLIELD